MKESTLGLVLIAISFFLITLGLFRRNSNFVELRKVFIEHMALFKNARYQYFIFMSIRWLCQLEFRFCMLQKKRCIEILQWQ